MDTKYGNALLIYGGGLCDSANFVMRTYAKNLKESGLFDKVYVGFYSFEAMVTPDYIKEWSDDISVKAEESFGGYFGTCRDVWLTDVSLQKSAINLMHTMNIQNVFVCGGDGSARNCAEIATGFANAGIMINFVLPCTVDGIEGGKSVGLKPAVKMSCQVIEQLSSTCLNTRSGFKAPGLIVELQGRNRDDILANVLNKLKLETCCFNQEIILFAVPANCAWNCERLIEIANAPENSQKPILVLVSEGATNDMAKRFGMSIRDYLAKSFERKTRTFEVAHLTQMNGATTGSDKREIQFMIRKAIPFVCEAVKKREPFAVVYTGDSTNDVKIEKIDYYAKLNPRNNQNPTISSELESNLNRYLP